MQTVREGGVVVRVPEQPEQGTGDSVFYNPEQELNRDVTVAALRAFRERVDRSDGAGAETYLDATTATGVRGVRAAADGWDVTCLDVDPEAVDLARANFRASSLIMVCSSVNAKSTFFSLRLLKLGSLPIRLEKRRSASGDAAFDGTPRIADPLAPGARIEA